MRIINLDVADLYLSSRQVITTSYSGVKTDLLQMQLGTPIYKGLCSFVNFGGINDWNISETEDLVKNRFSLKTGFEGPTIWDEEGKSKGCNLLFTGVYGSDCATIISKLFLRLKDIALLSRVKVIAGGYIPYLDGSTWVNLVLLVPPEVNYILDKNMFSCKSGNRIQEVSGKDFTLEDIFRNCAVL
jgi:hypothetical protein